MSITTVFLHKAVNDPELRRLRDLHSEGCLGYTNIRRAAEGEPLRRTGDPMEALIAHLDTCRYCQREVELYREAVRESNS